MIISKAEAQRIMTETLSAKDRRNQDFLKKYDALLHKVIDETIREMAKKGNSRVSFSHLVEEFSDEFTFQRVDYESTYKRIEAILRELDYNFVEWDGLFGKKKGISWEMK